MQQRRIMAILGVAILATLVSVAIDRAPWLGSVAERAELATLDWRVRSAARPSDPADRPISLVLFDSTSVAAWPYLSPYPRGALADLITAISSGGAAVIGVDVFLDRRFPALEAIDGGDSRLREAIRRAGNVVLASRVERTPRGRVLRAPHPFFSSVAVGSGAVELPTPYDMARTSPLLLRTDTGLTPGMPLTLYARFRGLDLRTILTDATRNGTLDIPATLGLPRGLDDRGLDVPLHFAGPPSRTGRGDGAFPAFSAAAVRALGGTIPVQWFRGRIVLIGTGFHEERRFRSPFYEHRDTVGLRYGWTYGTEVLATATANLIDGRVPRAPNVALTIPLLFGLALLVATGVFWGGALAGAGTTVIFAGALVAAAWLAFDRNQTHVPIAVPLAAMSFSFLGSTGWLALLEGRPKRRIRSALDRYVAPRVLREIVRDPDRLRLRGERRPVTILCADVGGLSRLTETMPPEQVVGFLDHYIEAMAGLVIAENGMLDRSMGQGIRALFGAPAPRGDHALGACRAAHAMRRRFRERSPTWTAAGWPPLALTIGVDTGERVVGNIGGSTRFDYTALGAPVHLAARLASLGSVYGVEIIISEHTRRAGGNRIVTRELDVVAVSGNSKPLQIFELVGMEGGVAAWPGQFLVLWARGIAAFRAHDFSLAADYFHASAELDPSDAPAMLYLSRCRAYIAEPPPEDLELVYRWDGD